MFASLQTRGNRQRSLSVGAREEGGQRAGGGRTSSPLFSPRSRGRLRRRAYAHVRTPLTRSSRRVRSARARARAAPAAAARRHRRRRRPRRQRQRQRRQQQQHEPAAARRRRSQGLAVLHRLPGDDDDHNHAPAIVRPKAQARQPHVPQARAHPGRRPVRRFGAAGHCAARARRRRCRGRDRGRVAVLARAARSTLSVYERRICDAADHL